MFKPGPLREKDPAKDILTIDIIYTVFASKSNGYCSMVALEEFPEQAFDVMLFYYPPDS